MKALAKTILLCASLHLVLLFVIALSTGNYELVNIWNILDIDLILPGVEKGMPNFIASYISIAVVYAFISFVSKKNR